MATAKKSMLREGFLLKRQRGRKMNTDLKKLKFQQRLIQLSQSELKYLKDGKDRGQYSVKEITIVEKVPDVTFGKYCFQIGNEREVMYFTAKSEKERDAWIEAFRIAASLNSNTMLSHYHTGAYGQVDQRKWSCCGATERESPGCQKCARHAHRERASTLTTSDHDQEMLSRSKSNKFHSQSVPARYFYQDEEELESSQSSQFDGTTLTEEDYSQTAESPTELDPHGKQLGRVYRYDAQSVKSVDSGLGMQNRRYESASSLGVGEGLSPHTYRKRLQRKQKGIESNSELSLNSIIPEPSAGNWTPLRSVQMDKSTSIVKAVFRNAEMLVTAYMDEKSCVNIATANVTNPEEDGNVYKTVKSIGSIDIWRKHLALGSPKLQLIDTTEWTWAKTLVNGDKPHHCAFKPDGSLVSAVYDSSIIDVWSPVHSLCSESSDDVVDEIKPEAQLHINSTTHIISSLSVSPNRDEPWLAVGLRATDSDTSSHRVYIFDCDQNQQVWEQQLDTSSHESQAGSHVQYVANVHTSFSHDGRQLAVGCGNHLRVFRPKSQELVFNYPFPDGTVTSLSYSPTSSYLSVGLSSGQVKIFGEPLTLSTSKQFTLPMSKVYEKDPNYMHVH